MSVDAATQARLVGLFVDEAGESLGTLVAAHARLAAATADDDLQEFGRTAHGLKGAAAALGFARLASQLHALEAASLELPRLVGSAREARHAQLGRALEVLEHGVAHMAAAGLATFPDASAAAVERALAGRAADAHAEASGPTPTSSPATGARAEGAEDRLSVPAAEVDEALRQAASLARAALQLHERLAGDGGGAGGGAGAAVAAQGLAAGAERLEAAIAGLRLLPAEVALSGLEEEVAELAGRLGRHARLEIEGREVRADRRTLQVARGLVRHLVRNALDHGLERPEARRAAGKPEAGRLAVRLAPSGGALQVTVEDDGAGFDVAAARQALAHRERQAKGEAAAARLAALPDPEVLARFAAEGGSTRGAVTEVSGRGLGLSAVAAAARDAGGTFAIRSARGEGSAVTFSLPLQVYAVEVLVATAGGHVVGLPVQGLERTVLLAAAGEAVRAGPAGRTLAAGEGIVPLVALAEVLGPVAEPSAERFALVVHGAEGAVAVGVEEVGAVVAVVPVAVPGVAGRGAPVSGLARLADGTTLQILDPQPLAAAARAASRRPEAARPAPRRAEAPAAATVAPGAGAGAGAEPRPGRTAPLEVVLAEDSLSTREVLRLLLEAQGFRVRLAADGEEALARLRERTADVLVSDINMPRRDGLSLTRALRADPVLARLPVVLLTSQDDDAARAAGAAAGADAYLVKSRFDAEVLSATLARIGLGARR